MPQIVISKLISCAMARFKFVEIPYYMHVNALPPWNVYIAGINLGIEVMIYRIIIAVLSHTEGYIL